MRNASNLVPEAGAFPSIQPQPAAAASSRAAARSAVAAVRPPSAGEARNDAHFTKTAADHGDAAEATEFAAAEAAEVIRFDSLPAQPGRASLAAIVAAMASALLEWLRGVRAREVDADPGSWRSRREIRIQAALLRDLDPHILRDIGIHDPEAYSIVAERYGAAEAARVRVLLDARQAGG